MSEANANESHSCPKCGGQMERGGIRGDNSTVWGRVKETNIFGAKAVQMSAPYFIVDAYCCEKCGFLELYAVREQGK